jgi:hypothetical protein
MSKILVGYSPYRNDLRQARQTESTHQAAAAAAVQEVIKIKVSPTMMMAGLFITSLLLGSLYLWNFNKVATKGYILKRLEVSRQELKEQSDLRTLNLAKAKAMNQIISSGAIDHMRKPANVEFVYGENVIAKADL